MRPIGFSTGALAHSDFRRGLSIVRNLNVHAIELSALREWELKPLVEALDDLELSQFSYVSVHAPSAIALKHEVEVVELLLHVTRRNWPIVVHPDAIHNPRLWRQLGSSLCIENTDKRKPTGRTADELRSVFRQFPDASFCFDVGHAKQVDSTMTVAYFMLKEFGSVLRQVHLSEVNTASRHDSLSYGSILAFREVSHMIPEHIPVILETPVSGAQIESEIERAGEALPLAQAPALTR